jgi:hypothetical protein
MALHRRTFLKGTATVPLVAVAGCMEQFTDSEEPPEYARWVPAESIDTDGAFFIYYDWSALEDFEDLEESLPDDHDDIGGYQPGGETPEGVDQLLLTPVFVGAFGALAIGFSLIPYEFVGDLISDISGEEMSTDDGMDSGPDIGETTGTLMTGDAVVFEGNFDVDAIAEAAENYEAVDERDDFTIYEGTEGDFISVEGYAFGASEDAIVLSILEGEGRSAVDTMLDTRAGDTDRMADRSDDAEWALGTAGHGHIAVGAWGDLESNTKGSDDEMDLESDPEDSLADLEDLGETDGEVYSLAVSNEDLTGRMAAGYSDEEEMPERETVESQLGNTADERDISLDGTRLSVTGRWDISQSTPESTS